jgi:DMSO/TMAO reductase YedYZ heme-binding membrane subunit/nitrite reductase/ring-hydroxylating ferredoxin subunit
MSLGYKAVGWSRHKKVYDAAVTAAVLLYIAAFFIASSIVYAPPNAPGPEVVLIRATGSCAIILLHVILCIGPLARLDRRVLPILYNRRHLGVITFLVALVHAAVVTGYYHGFGSIQPFLSLLTSNTNFSSLKAFPFEALGIVALLILFLMAATSHDFWLKNMGARAWKSLHMLVYPAYALLIGHVALGAMQSDRGSTIPILLSIGVIIVSTLHLLAARREARTDQGTPALADGWIDVGPAADIPEARARIICAPAGERIAIFNHHGSISAVTNVCAHQGGPLGEGRIIDGCITCPWHGWQYRPADGCSPPPFAEKIATFPVRITAGRVEVHPVALPPGTPVNPARLHDADAPEVSHH